MSVFVYRLNTDFLYEFVVCHLIVLAITVGEEGQFGACTHFFDDPGGTGICKCFRASVVGGCLFDSVATIGARGEDDRTGKGQSWEQCKKYVWLHHEVWLMICGIGRLIEI